MCLITSNALILLICLSFGGVREAYSSKFIDTLHNVESMAENEVSLLWNEARREFESGCQCITYDCGCCTHIEEKEIELNSTICVNVTYLSHDYGLSLTVTVNKYTIFNETVSVRNPPPVCLGVPYIKELVDACIRLYDIDASRTTLHACVRFEARMKIVLIAKYELGCFNIGPPALKRENKISVASHALSNTGTGSGDSYINMTMTAVAVAAGLIVLVIITTCGVVAIARKRGNVSFIHAIRRQQTYGSLVSEA